MEASASAERQSLQKPNELLDAMTKVSISTNGGVRGRNAEVTQRAKSLPR